MSGDFDDDQEMLNKPTSLKGAHERLSALEATIERILAHLDPAGTSQSLAPKDEPNADR